MTAQEKRCDKCGSRMSLWCDADVKERMDNKNRELIQEIRILKQSRDNFLANNTLTLCPVCEINGIRASKQDKCDSCRIKELEDLLNKIASCDAYDDKETNEITYSFRISKIKVLAHKNPKEFIDIVFDTLRNKFLDRVDRVIASEKEVGSK